MQQITLIMAIRNSALRNRLVDGLARRAEFRILRQTIDLMQTYTAVEELAPKVVLIDQALAQLPEFEVMHALFVTLDVRWLVVSGAETPRGARMPIPKSDLFAVDDSMPVDRIADSVLTLARSQRGPAPAVASATQLRALGRGERVALIGASTGGVDALSTVLSGFPADCPATLIVQHTGAGFGDSLARLLDRQCAAKVTLATDGAELHRGSVLIAAGIGAHMELVPGRALRIRISSGGAVSGHMPSADMLFQSAVPEASRISAALLTGMGRDGAQGLLALRKAGARTLAQDEATSIVYGMPRAAVEAGAVDQVLPLNAIAPALLKSCNTPARALS